MTKVLWTKEEDARLTKLWNEGKLTAPQIGRKMGRSKCGIIGRAHRLCLVNKPKGGGRPRKHPKEAVPKALKPPKSPKRPGKPIIFKVITVADRKPPQYVAPTQKWLGEGVHLLDTAYGQCRAIMGSSDDPRGLAVCCGKPVKEGTGLSFCPEHYAQYTTSSYWSR